MAMLDTFFFVFSVCTFSINEDMIECRFDRWIVEVGVNIPFSRISVLSR